MLGGRIVGGSCIPRFASCAGFRLGRAVFIFGFSAGTRELRYYSVPSTALPLLRSDLAVTAEKQGLRKRRLQITMSIAWPSAQLAPRLPCGGILVPVGTCTS